jgi:hypothetical protein
VDKQRGQARLLGLSFGPSILLDEFGTTRATERDVFDIQGDTIDVFG